MANCSSQSPSSWALPPYNGTKTVNTSLFSYDYLKCPNPANTASCPTHPGWVTNFTNQLAWTFSNNLEHVGRASGPLKIMSLSFRPNVQTSTRFGLWCGTRSLRSHATPGAPAGGSGPLPR